MDIITSSNIDLIIIILVSTIVYKYLTQILDPRSHKTNIVQNYYLQTSKSEHSLCEFSNKYGGVSQAVVDLEAKITFN